LTDDQRSRFPMGIIGAARYNPDLDADGFLHGSAEYFRELFSRCETTTGQESTGGQHAVPVPVPRREAVGRLRDANDVKPRGPQDLAALRDVLRRVALPQRPLDKPMLVINGEDDPQVLPEWVRSAVSRSCALGGHIEYVHLPGVTHLDVVPKSAEATQRWIADRFAGTPPPSNCPAGQTYPNGPSQATPTAR